VQRPSWIAVVPVKPLGTAKTRLSGERREQLALGFARDTVAAVLACDQVSEVLVVTDDPVVAGALGEAGAYVVPDKPDAGLNAAVRHGATLAGANPVVALTADLPALRTADLAGALAAAADARTRCFVPDAPGTGTVLLAAPTGQSLDPRFGPGSAAAHAASGATRLTGEWPSLRRDVDTLDDLAEAAALGLGAFTRSLLR
jgi:2-phospho-L-lactate guanylyltransferase